MKRRIIVIITLCFFLNGPDICCSDPLVYLNAFGETAAAYLNDSFLLLGTTADAFVSGIMPKDTCLEITRNVQKRVRLIRAKVKVVSKEKIADVDARLLGLLDNAYACLDHHAWTLIQYIEDRTPDNAKKFDSQRTECLEKIKRVAEFYMALPPSPEVAEPLSTR